MTNFNELSPETLFRLRRQPTTPHPTVDLLLAQRQGLSGMIDMAFRVFQIYVRRTCKTNEQGTEEALRMLKGAV